LKIQHWAIIFIIIILPFSIITRSTINKKSVLLREETRYNNIIDNASYDAVSQILEASEELELGKNIPITKDLADAAIDRFFNTLAVNFNLPVLKNANNKTRNSARAYFSQYIPAIVIVGYDGLYVYSYEEGVDGYEYVLKPKIPYSCKINENITINFTLDNYVELIFNETAEGSSNGMLFGHDMPGTPASDGTPTVADTRILKGYVGVELDNNNDGIDDFRDIANTDPLTGYYHDGGSYYYVARWDKAPDGYNAYSNADKSNNDPFSIATRGNGIGDSDPDVGSSKTKYILKYVSTQESNVSYLLYELSRNDTSTVENLINDNLRFLIDCYDYDASTRKTSSGANYNNSDYGVVPQENIKFSEVNIDYSYDDEGNVTTYASYFHRLRRETIINLIQSVLKQEFNQHNQFADFTGMNYTFSIPDIGRDQWNNTIDDVSVLSFIQGVPMGYDTYYNNYSLGGARIVQATNYFAETLNVNGAEHKVYHRAYCPLIPRDSTGKAVNKSVIESAGNKDMIANLKEKLDNGTYTDVLIPGTTVSRKSATSGIEREFLTQGHAHNEGYYACSECM